MRKKLGLFFSLKYIIRIWQALGSKTGRPLYAEWGKLTRWPSAVMELSTFMSYFFVDHFLKSSSNRGERWFGKMKIRVFVFWAALIAIAECAIKINPWDYRHNCSVDFCESPQQQIQVIKHEFQQLAIVLEPVVNNLPQSGCREQLEYFLDGLRNASLWAVQSKYSEGGLFKMCKSLYLAV